MKLWLFSLTLLCCKLSLAQVCSQGLGDPIVKFTFGSGTATYGPALASGITTLAYSQNNCVNQSATDPNGGGYSIVHSPGISCFGGAWVNFTGDHTGDPNGYFMLINAAANPNIFYTQQVDGLCSQTSYQFSAWVINMASLSDELQPDIIFTIEKTDGTVLKTFDSGPVPINPTAQWHQYAFYFTTPPGISSVIVSMKNNAPGGYGNDLGIDDITFRTSGPSIKIGMTGYTGDTATLCSDPANTLGFTSTVGSCYTSTDYQWQESTDNGGTWTNIPGAVSSTYSAFPTTTGSYLYRLAAAQTGNIGLSACQVVSSTDTVVVLQTQPSSVSIRSDPTSPLCADTIVHFFATDANPGPHDQYDWMVNGTSVAVATNSPTEALSGFSDGDQVKCVITSDAVCASPATAISNIITIHFLPHVLASTSIVSSANDICKDSVVTFTATPVNGGITPAYSWTVNGKPVGTNSPVYSSGSLNDGDMVGVVMTSSEYCSSPAPSNIITMTVYDVPAVKLTPDTIIAAFSAITLNPVVTGAIDQWQWDPSTGLYDPWALRPTAAPVSTTVYQVTVSNDHCAAAAKERVEVFYDLAMPNAFTPNGDGRNDQYRVPPFLNLTIRQFWIYNRWGALVFATTNGAQGWDGTLNGQAQPSGTYVWMIEYVNPILKKTIRRKGTLELIR
jgi:gliding motility-associated-like protein